MPSVFITGKISNISLDFSVYESISLSYSLVLGSNMWFVKHGSLSGESCAITGFQVLLTYILYVFLNIHTHKNAHNLHTSTFFHSLSLQICTSMAYWHEISKFFSFSYFFYLYVAG